MHNFYHHETTESLLNAESSSLPSVLTDPGPIVNEERGDNLTDGDDGDNFESRLKHQDYGDEGGGSCELAVHYNNHSTTHVNNVPGTSRSMVDGSVVQFKQIRSRQKRTRTNASRQLRALSAKRGDRKKRRRTHSETDLRKMRYFFYY